MELNATVKQQFRDDLALARMRAVIAQLQADLTWLDKQWARHGIDCEVVAYADALHTAYRLFEIDEMFDHARNIDPRHETMRESKDERIEDAIAKAQAPICHAYQVAHGGEFLDERTQRERRRQEQWESIRETCARAA